MAKKSATKASEPQSESPGTNASAEPTINKSEAARRAIAEGIEAPVEAVAFIKSK